MAASRAAYAVAVVIATLIWAFGASAHDAEGAGRPRWQPAAAGAGQPGACRSFRVCHNSRGFDFTSVELFAALDRLFQHLELSPVTEHVRIVQLEAGELESGVEGACTQQGCCCSTPVEVQLSLPTPEALEAASEFVSRQLPTALGAAAVCVGELRGSCDQQELDAATQRVSRLLLELSDAPEEQDSATRPVPAMPHGFTPLSAAVMAAAAAEQASGYGTYGYGAAGHAGGGYSAGGYGDGGGYGGYGGYAGYGYGYYSGQVAAALERAAAHQPGQQQGRPQQQRPAGRSLIQNTQRAEPAEAPAAVPGGLRGTARRAPAAAPCPDVCAPCPGCGGGRPAASCYCRFDARRAGWALEEPACRAALEVRCGSGPGSLLQCADVAAAGAGAGAAPAAAAIAAFLFTDCPPAAPCGCKALLLSDDRGPPASAAALRARCCGELGAHCRAPFSGLPCSDVEAFCAAEVGGPPDAAVGAAEALVRSYVLVKTHGADCSAAGGPPAALKDGQAAPLLLARDAAAERGWATRRGAAAAAATVAATVAASAVAAAAALAGILALVRHFAIRRYTHPLLGDEEWFY